MTGHRSLSGDRLEGNKLLRLVFLDESGISGREPWVVVCAVVVDADKQLGAIEDHLDAIIQKHIPKDIQSGFYFHATDIFSGGKKGKSIFYDKTEWPEERRFRILDDLVAIPLKFKLPVCFAGIENDTFRLKTEALGFDKQQHTVGAHVVALFHCAMSVESWMRNNTSDEYCILFAENNDHVRGVTKNLHSRLRDKNVLEKEGINGNPFVPFVKIKEGISFAEKSESRLLQVADICAWTLRKSLTAGQKNKRFFVPLFPQLVTMDVSLLQKSL